MKTFCSAIKQAIFSRDFLIGLVGVVVVIFASSISDVFDAFRGGKTLSNGFYIDFIRRAIVSDAMTLAVPIIAALPFTVSFVNDIKSGFIRSYLHRTNRNNYIVSKCIACAISGGLVLVLGIMLSYVIAALAFIPMEDAVSKDVITYKIYIDLTKRIILMFLSGAIWSLCGITLAAMTGSKYMAYASPFIIYYVLIILYERYFEEFYIIYPKEWINPSAKWMLGEYGVILWILGLIIGVSAVFYFTVKRRISQL